MSDHPNAAIARRTLEAFNTGDMQAMSDGLDDNVVWHEIGNPNPVMGKAALAARMVGSESPTTRSPASSTTWWPTTTTRSPW